MGEPHHLRSHTLSGDPRDQPPSVPPSRCQGGGLDLIPPNVGSQKPPRKTHRQALRKFLPPRQMPPAKGGWKSSPARPAPPSGPASSRQLHTSATWYIGLLPTQPRPRESPSRARPQVRGPAKASLSSPGQPPGWAGPEDTHLATWARISLMRTMSFSCCAGSRSMAPCSRAM